MAGDAGPQSGPRAVRERSDNSHPAGLVSPEPGAEFFRTVLAARDDPREVITDEHARYFGT
jgi:hypothetical protein